MPERFAFIHSYLSDKDRKDSLGSPLPDKPTRGVILAAAELYRTGHVDKIALSVIPELSKPIVRRLGLVLGKRLKEADLISFETSATTRQEAKTISKLAKKGDEVVCICIQPHKRRVRNNVTREINGNIDKVVVKAFDEILGVVRKGTRYEGVIRNFGKWEMVKQMASQEKKAQLVEKIPKIGPFLIYVAPDLIFPKQKIRFQRWLLDQL